jgi:hypothetical protein
MSSRPYVDLIRSAMRTCGADFPPAVAKALDDRDRLAQLTPGMRSPSMKELDDALFAAILEGRDPFADETVRSIVIAQAIGGNSGSMIEQHVETAAQQRIVDAMTDTADEIINTLKTVADAAGRELASAHRTLGDLDLTNSTAVLKLGVDAAEAWAGALKALKTLRTIDKAWFTMTVLTHCVGDIAPSLRLADLDLDTYQAVGRKAEPWDLVRAGATIDLATATTARERVARINTEREQRNAGAPTFADAYRRHRGIATVAGVGT